MAINPEIMQQIRAELQTAPHGFRGELVARRAEMYGVSEATIYRSLQLKARTRKDAPKRPELWAAARIVAQIKKRPPTEAGEISTDQAMGIAVTEGHVGPWLIEEHPATINRCMQELGTTKKSIRASRYQAKLPNQAHHFDASTSKFFYIARQMPDGEYILKMHRPAKHYKNKPIPVDALRPWYYGLIDDHSGRIIVDLVAAQGENAQDSIMMLERFWREMGLPKKLLADQGMLKKCIASSTWVQLVGVELPQMMPYASRGHGKVERIWRTLWQRFEKPSYVVNDWDKYEITLTEHRRRLQNHIEEINAMPHRFERGVTRIDAWRRVMLNGGITILPEDSLAAAANETKRKVDVDGMLEYRGGVYEVKGLHDAWVNVYEGIFTDALVVKEIATGARFEVRDFKPLDEGEYRAHKQTEHQKMVKAGAELMIGAEALPYSGRGDAETRGRGDNIISLPIRRTEIEVASVFDVEHYACLEDAWAEIHETVGARMWTEQERRDVEQIVTEGKLAKDVVKSLAMDLREAVEMQKAVSI